MIVPIPLLLIAIGLGLTAVTAGVVLMWTRVLRWARQVLEPWLEEHLPVAVPWVRNAFAVIDKAASPMLRLAKASWANLRRHLLHQVAVFAEETNLLWVMRITTWLREELTPTQADTPVTKIETVQSVPFEELPDEVRAAWIRDRKAEQSVDITALQDHELQLKN